MKWRIPAFLKPKGEHSSELLEKVTLANYLAAVGTDWHRQRCCPTPLKPGSRKSRREVLKAPRQTALRPAAGFLTSSWDVLVE